MGRWLVVTIVLLCTVPAVFGAFVWSVERRLQALEADVEVIHALQFNVRPDFQRINRMLSRHERRITRIEDRMGGPM